MKLVNNTHYFSLNNRTYNVVPDNDSWQFQSSKRLSFSQRLYWEYKFIKSCGGQAFFYTFTYNNKSLPYYEVSVEKINSNTGKLEIVNHRFPCFNYEHIRLLTNGIISKVLRRKYGSQLRYFVACERGEGKGFRGKGMNPHYHVIFFISPLPDKVRKSFDVPYKRISPIQFCQLCKCVWQYNSTPNKYNHLVADYKSARFGHCQPGDDYGLITDFDALSYVSKYVVKDTVQTSNDLYVRSHFERYFNKLGYTYHSLYSYYNYLRSKGSVIDRKHFLEFSGLDKYFGWRSLTHRRDISYFHWFELLPDSDFYAFFESFNEYFKSLYLPAIIDKSYRDYCNIYGSKVRCSKSLGIYGLSFVHDVDSNPHFVIDKSDEVVSQPICLYYFRKIYMDVVRCPYSGNPLYVLNNRGIDLKCLFLKSSLDKLKRDVFQSFDILSSLRSDKDYISRLSSYGVSFSIYDNLVSCSDFSDILERFVVYRFIYQYRHYDSCCSLPSISLGFNYVNYLADYRSFLQSNYYTCDYSEIFLLKFIEYKRSPFFLSFDSHPAFSSYMQYFSILEGFLSSYLDFMSERKKSKFEACNELRQKLNAVKYSSVNSI